MIDGRHLVVPTIIAYWPLLLIGTGLGAIVERPIILRYALHQVLREDHRKQVGRIETRVRLLRLRIC